MDRELKLTFNKLVLSAGSKIVKRQIKEKREEDTAEISKKRQEIRGFRASLMDDLVKNGRKFEEMEKYHVTKKYGPKR